MSALYPHFGPQPTSSSAHAPTLSRDSHHSGRNRRAPRLSMSQQQQQHKFRNLRPTKDLVESPSMSIFRQRFEATRSFDLEDDMEFCPTLLTDIDMMTIHSASASERSSLASNSPDASPTQQPQQIAPSFSLNSSSPPFVAPPFHPQQNMKLHQPLATRARNAIPIINPATGISLPSPSPSVSPSRIQPGVGRRW